MYRAMCAFCSDLMYSDGSDVTGARLHFERIPGDEYLQLVCCDENDVVMWIVYVRRYESVLNHGPVKWRSRWYRDNASQHGDPESKQTQYTVDYAAAAAEQASFVTERVEAALMEAVLQRKNRTWTSWVPAPVRHAACWVYDKARPRPVHGY